MRKEKKVYLKEPGQLKLEQMCQLSTGLRSVVPFLHSFHNLLWDDYHFYCWKHSQHNKRNHFGVVHYWEAKFHQQQLGQHQEMSELLLLLLENTHNHGNLEECSDITFLSGEISKVVGIIITQEQTKENVKDQSAFLNPDQLKPGLRSALQAISLE